MGGQRVCWPPLKLLGGGEGLAPWPPFSYAYAETTLSKIWLFIIERLHFQQLVGGYKFQCRGVLLIWIIVGQGPVALEVGAGGWGLFGHFPLLYPFSIFLPFSGRLPDIDEILFQLAVTPKPTNQPTNQPTDATPFIPAFSSRKESGQLGANSFLNE